MSLQQFSSYPRIVLYARKSRELGNLAEKIGGLRGREALTKKAATDVLLVNELEKVASSLAATFKAIASAIPGSERVAKGLAYGTGAAVPLALGGSHLIERSGQEHEDRMSSLLGKGSLMAAGLGAGLFGMHQLGKSFQSSRNREDLEHALALRIAAHNAIQGGANKAASHEAPLFEKAAASYEAISALRKAIDSNSDDDPLCKKAAAALVIANGHLADLVGDILLGD